MRHDTEDRRRWIQEHFRTATLMECVRRWDVDHTTVLNDEKSLGVKLKRERRGKGEKHQARQGGINALASAFIKGQI